MPKRYAVLPPRGTLLASTDIHGNLEDLRALRGAYEAEGPRYSLGPEPGLGVRVAARP